MKTLIVAGAGSAIAAATLEHLANNGEQWNIVAYSRQDPSIGHPHVSWIEWDVANDFPGLPDEVESVDALMYCPGNINLKPFKSLKLSQFQEDMHINLFGSISLLQEVLPKMTAGGDVLYISSVAASTGMAYHASVASAKSAVEGFVKAMAAEYAPKNIRFNAVALSLTDTPLASRLLSSDDKRQAMAERHPLKRVGDPAEVGALAAHILAGQYSWMTGHIISMDGGIGALR